MSVGPHTTTDCHILSLTGLNAQMLLVGGMGLDLWTHFCYEHHTAVLIMLITTEWKQKNTTTKWKQNRTNDRIKADLAWNHPILWFWRALFASPWPNCKINGIWQLPQKLKSSFFTFSSFHCRVGDRLTATCVSLGGKLGPPHVQTIWQSCKGPTLCLVAR